MEPIICAGCGDPLPPRGPGRGRPRRWHNERCRSRARRRRAATDWRPLEGFPGSPVDRSTLAQWTAASLARVIEGAPNAPPEHQLQQAIVETAQLAQRAHALASELHPKLGLRAGQLADGLRSRLHETFPEIR